MCEGCARAGLAPDIRVNAVAPGVIVTPFHDQVSTPEQFEQWTATTPLRRNGDPDDIAKAVEFIIDNDVLCGETIDVNGGLRIR
jgi:3-oxoacyl-[acyl-carrier protein] reductase